MGVCAGLDYVAHEDLLPYTTTEQAPIQHELFDKFLMHDPESSECTVGWSLLLGLVGGCLV